MFIVFKVPGPTNAKFTFESIPNNTPVIINNLADAQLSYNSYKLMAYADLNQLFSLRTNIKSSINYLRNISDTIKKPTYEALVYQAEHQFRLMEEDDDLLNSFRTKRFVLCEFCGSIQHFLYGVMDANTARQYDLKINEIANATMKQHELIRNHTKIFRDAIMFNQNTFHRFEIEIRTLHKDIHLEQNRTTEELKHVQTEMQEQNLLQLIQLMLSEYHRLFDRIRRTLMDARSGKINEMIPKRQLIVDLKFINEQLESTQQLPINPNTEDAYHIFKYSGILSTIHEGKLLMEISIPIAEREKFRLYKATPIPMLVNQNYVITSIHSTYFLLNRDYTKYIPLDKKQLGMGNMMANGQMLYRPTTTILLSPKNICEWKLINDKTDIMNSCHFSPFVHPNSLITILENDIFYLAIHNETTLYEACNGTDFFPRHLKHSGTIRLDPGCTIKTANYIIRGHQTIRINSSSLVLPSIQPLKLNLAIFNSTILEKIWDQPTSNELTIIHNADELNHLIKKSNELYAMASDDLKIDEIHYDSTSNSLFSGAFSGLVSSLVVFITIGGILLGIFYKANLFSCLLRAIIKRSTISEADGEGFTLELPKNLTPKNLVHRNSMNHSCQSIQHHSPQ